MERMIKMDAAGYPSIEEEIEIGEEQQVWGWDHRGKCEIIQIFISHGKDIGRVGSIQFVYVENEKVVPSKRIGRSTGDSSGLDTVHLNYPSEFLTWVGGSFSDELFSFELCSITFGTNQGTYGPFGIPQKKEFCFRMGDRRSFGGFHGTHGDSGIYSIGVYVKPAAIVNSGLKPGPTLQIKEENNQN